MRKRTYAQANTSVVAQSKKQRTYYKKKISLPQRLGNLNTTSLLSRGSYVKAYLKYAETFSLNPPIGQCAAYVFASNGLFDPNISATGHQPAGFDQYMALYELYTVTAAKIKVEGYSLDTTNNQVIAVSNRDLAATSNDFRVYVENGATKWCTIGRQGSGNDLRTMTMYMDMSKFGSYKDLIDSDENAGTDSSNPAETQYFHCIVTPGDSAADTAGVVFNVEITYEVYFRQPRQVGLS